MPESCLFCGLPEKSYKPTKSDIEWIRHINLKNFRYGLIPKPKAKPSVAEPFLIEEENAETEKPERSMVRKRAMQAVRPSRDQVRA
jgi:hypothetical protein